MCFVFIQTERQIEERRDREKYGGRGRRRRREHATECPKPLEQGIFLVDWAIHSRHVTLNFFHYKTLLPSPLQRQIACTYFTQWNIASPLKQSFSSQSCEKMFETVISLCSQSTGYSLGFSYFCRLHKLTLYDSTCSFQIWFPNTLVYVMCVHHHQLWCALIFTVARFLLLPFHFRCYWCDIRHRRDNKNQFVTVCPYGALVLKSEFYTKSIWWHMM